MSIRNRAIDNQLIKPITDVKGWKQKTKLIDLQKDLAKALNIPFTDLCCEEGYQAPNGFPVRFYNDELQQLTPEGVWSAIDLNSNSLFELTANKDEAEGYAGLDDNTYLKMQEFNPLVRSLKKDYLENTPVLTSLPHGGISDNLVTTVKNGAMTTATIIKEGNFDKITVIDGDNTSYIRFSNLKLSDNQATFKMSVKINDYQTNGALDCLLGIRHFPDTLTNDGALGAAFRFAMYFNLTQKTAHLSNGGNGVYTDITTGGVKTSAGTLVADGDIVDIEIQRLSNEDKLFASLINRRTGEFISGVFDGTAVMNQRYWCTAPGHLGIVASNGVFTILSYEAHASVPKKPLLALVGDSYISGDGGYLISQNLASLMINALPYYVVCTAGNGAFIHNVAQIQLQDVIKLRPKYVYIGGILPIYYGHFDDGNANQTAWENSFYSVMKAVVAYGGIPILPKWQTGAAGYLNNNGTAWNTYVDTVVLPMFPTTLTVDFTNAGFTFNANTHPTALDFSKMKDGLVNLLLSEGYTW